MLMGAAFLADVLTKTVINAEQKRNFIRALKAVIQKRVSN